MPTMKIDESGIMNVEQTIKGVYLNAMAIATHSVKTEGNRTTISGALNKGGTYSLSFDSATGQNAHINGTNVATTLIDTDEGKTVVMLIENQTEEATSIKT